MITRLIIVLLLICLALSEPSHYPIQNYELVRPLQYFFYLLEMKSKFNPMLGGLLSMGSQCSSKTGPFCRITEHEPFQTHQLRATSMNEQNKNIYNALMFQQKQTFQSYENIVKHDHEVFMIRNDLVNQYEAVLKQAIGDRMHLASMLPPELFETLI